MRNLFLLMQLFVALTLWPNGYAWASEFSLPGLTTTEHLLFNNEKSEKLTIYIFLSKDCPCSKAYMGYFNTLIDQYPEYRFVGIHAIKNKSKNDLNTFLNSKEVKNSKLTLFNDPELQLANYFKAIKTPHVFIVNDKKIIYSGAVANSMMPQNAKIFYLEKALKEFKETGSISTTETKALGCYIVR